MTDPAIPMKLTVEGAKDTDIPYPTLQDSWFDCSSKLTKVRELVATWPKGP